MIQCRQCGLRKVLLGTMAILLVLPFMGCSTKYAWYHPGKEEGARQQDLYACQTDAAKYSFEMGKAGNKSIIEKRLGACMELRGYRWLAEEDAEMKGAAAGNVKKANVAGSTVSIKNRTTKAVRVYLGFNKESCYQTTDFPFCTRDAGNSSVCSFDLASNASREVSISKDRCKASFVVTANKIPWTGCAVTQAEFTIRDWWDFNKRYMDTYDISLINGFNVPMSIIPVSGTSVGPVQAATGNQKRAGVFPLACTTCTKRDNPPAACNVDVNDLRECHAAGAQGTPQPLCQLTQESVPAYEVNILE